MLNIHFNEISLIMDDEKYCLKFSLRMLFVGEIYLIVLVHDHR